MKPTKCKSCLYGWKEQDHRVKKRECWCCHVAGGDFWVRKMKSCPMKET